MLSLSLASLLQIDGAEQNVIIIVSACHEREREGVVDLKPEQLVVRLLLSLCPSAFMCRSV